MYFTKLVIGLKGSIVLFLVEKKEMFQSLEPTNWKNHQNRNYLSKSYSANFGLCNNWHIFWTNHWVLCQTVNIKIESPMFVLNGSHIRQLFQKIQIIFFTTGFGFLFFCPNFLVFLPSLSHRTWKRVKNQQI